VKAVLHGPSGEENCEAGWIAGCDGAHSAVRKTLGLEFPGGTYEHLFYVADVQARGPVINGELNIAVDKSDFLGVFPAARGRQRAPHRHGEAECHSREGGNPGPRSQMGRREREILSRMKLEVERVNWFSTYHVHHRVVNRFRAGRAFVLGDAAHIHSPVGAQGMNTGLGDAVNLAWKLAMVIAGRASESILDTYETERIAFARLLVATTDRAFTFVTRDGALARFIRLNVVPPVLPRLLASEAARRFMFRRISQIMIEYRESALSAGQAGKVHGGDRLPWVPDNFTPLASLNGRRTCTDRARWPGRCMPQARRFAAHSSVERWPPPAPGSRKDALYLVRPDGLCWARGCGRPNPCV
jgi:2-polyprenyl-6-methoxyphenol hydroxylase-like FAD-dependent oxidoreductase